MVKRFCFEQREKSGGPLFTNLAFEIPFGHIILKTEAKKKQAFSKMGTALPTENSEKKESMQKPLL